MAKTTALRKRLTPSVPFTIEFTDTKGTYRQPVQLAFDFNALAAVEEATGVNLLNNYLYIYKMDAINVSLFFWAALLAYQPEYADKDGLEKVRSFLDFGNWEPAAIAVIEAFKLSLSPAQRQVIEDATKAVEEKAKKAKEDGSETKEESGNVPLDPTVQEK